jgi:polysaccharide deacetylase family protein (PEP-CTERM system associated)
MDSSAIPHRPPPPPPGFFTVDVEDWYHPLVKDPAAWAPLEDRIVPACDRLLRLLAETGNRGTFFVLGWLAERHPELVRAILAGGHEVGCHGHHHLSLRGLDPARFRNDLRASLRALRAAGATEVVSYRAPYFSLDDRTRWALPILEAEGIRIDSSLFPLGTGYYGRRGAPGRPHRFGPLLEFPISLPAVAGQRLPLTGGFYARFFPRSWILWAVARQIARGEAPVFYVHPWELDPAQPRLRAGRFLTYRHYLHLDRTEATVRALLARHRWRPLRDGLDAAAVAPR